MLAYTSVNEQQTEEFAAQFARKLQNGDIIAYRGGLGAGKTAFTRGLAKGLGLQADVSSPTFALVHEYQGNPTTLYHFDMYRVESLDSLESTGFFDYLGANGILAVEWSENIQEFLPEEAIYVTIQPDGGHIRHITIEGGRF